MGRGLGKAKKFSTVKWERIREKIAAKGVARPAQNIVALSGGKDSTAMALLLADRGEDFVCLFTPTGNELPEVRQHIDRLCKYIDRRLVILKNKSLGWWIEFYNGLPNWRMRWCTRQIKIEPCIVYLLFHPGSTLNVGLRADEPLREGLYGPYAEYRYPLREAEMSIEDVLAYIQRHEGVKVPVRTDCAVCPYQRLGEWYVLWRDLPEEYEQGIAWEDQTGHTFRSPSRDTWPASLRELRDEFKSGRIPKSLPDTDGPEACRVCRF